MKQTTKVNLIYWISIVLVLGLALFLSKVIEPSSQIQKLYKEKWVVVQYKSEHLANVAHYLKLIDDENVLITEYNNKIKDIDMLLYNAINSTWNIEDFTQAWQPR